MRPTSLNPSLTHMANVSISLGTTQPLLGERRVNHPPMPSFADLFPNPNCGALSSQSTGQRSTFAPVADLRAPAPRAPAMVLPPIPQTAPPSPINVDGLLNTIDEILEVGTISRYQATDLKPDRTMAGLKAAVRRFVQFVESQGVNALSDVRRPDFIGLERCAYNFPTDVSGPCGGRVGYMVKSDELRNANRRLQQQGRATLTLSDKQTGATYGVVVRRYSATAYSSKKDRAQTVGPAKRTRLSNQNSAKREMYLFEVSNGPNQRLSFYLWVAHGRETAL